MFHQTWKSLSWVATLVLFCAMGVSQANAQHESGDEHEASSNAFHVDTFRTWLFRSFLPDSNDDADALGLEFVSSWPN